MSATAVETVPVSACQLRAGDVVAMCGRLEPTVKVAVAEYAPQGGCIAFRIGFEPESAGQAPGGGTYFMRTPGWYSNGIYSWSSSFHVSRDDAATINARVDLFHEVYPELAPS